MTIDKERSSEGIYSEEDRKIIVSLLNEYSEKLLDMCNRLDVQQRRSGLFAFSFIGLCFATVLLFVVLPIYDSSLMNSQSTEYTTLVYLFFLLAFWFIIVTIYDSERKLTFLEWNAKMLSIKLKKVIRVVSQSQEHIITNFASRIEADLRLADAESAVHHYEILMSSRRPVGKLFSFLRFF
ncbi:MAG: hypothetical protein AAGG51_05160 [Cyanobacteria bacterium P01_G01_bin.54]